ncbi:MAG: MarR family winged helix-turn-helix transcriptional regulator [Steroidobacteraceae bacterium]
MNRPSPTESLASDAETRASSDHHEALRLWLRLLAATGLVEQRIRKLLQERFGTTLPRFDLMSQLERAPEGLRMGELSQRMMVTGGNVTAITDALEAEGLVIRVADPTDRRAQRVRLTPMGRRAFQQMAVEHEGWIVEAFDDLSPREMQSLAQLLARIKARMRQLELAE